MPDPTNDRDQLRFAQIKRRMVERLMENLPPFYIEELGVKSNKGLLEKLAESDFLMAVLESCAYEAQCIEEERARGA